ncbi:alpha/beta hydrolase fold domain-containing protein [Nocardia aurantia]|uniref:Monoterpene epsilon-lactone hydrolase n=1 Tax=Nocardia aurantia TaxID=2585199 RepID=A0A7K0DUX2_9NOCA|nr:alpha/beta hydrolase fold domain-containing protein [Nocardia aurantia]MQY29327.1 Monoterpene epsilon-lactone hydrolase [Nocardia aurantia]
MSVQMDAVAVYMRMTTQRRMNTPQRARERIAAPKGSALPPARLRGRHRVERRTEGGFTCYTITPRNRSVERSALYLHGGGYISEIVRQHWALIAQLADAGVRVEVPIYGLAPRHGYREAYEFLTAVYRRSATAPDAIPMTILGDSAGGGLALGFTQTLPRLQLPPPARLVLIAPWLDLTLANPDAASIRDPWLSRTGLLAAGTAWAGGDDLADPRLSPINGPLSALPPTDVYIGTRDLFYPDALLLRQRAANVSVTVCQGAIHVYPLVPVPEGRAAARTIVETVARG